MGGLHYNTTEDSLKAFYEQWGEVTEVIVMRDQSTKRYSVSNRGFDCKMNLLIFSVLRM